MDEGKPLPLTRSLSLSPTPSPYHGLAVSRRPFTVHAPRRSSAPLASSLSLYYRSLPLSHHFTLPGACLCHNFSLFRPSAFSLAPPLASPCASLCSRSRNSGYIETPIISNCLSAVLVQPVSS